MIDMLTARQREAWSDAIESLRAYTTCSIPAAVAAWDITYSEESRPGRGHAINATYVDGEIFAQILMDVYGHPNVSIAYLDWIHVDSNEECDCDPCENQRETERAEGNR